jgi:hypothetical protein
VTTAIGCQLGADTNGMRIVTVSGKQKDDRCGYHDKWFKLWSRGLACSLGTVSVLDLLDILVTGIRTVTCDN